MTIFWRLVSYKEIYMCTANLTNMNNDKDVASGEPFGKAGGYGIQGYASLFIHKIDGDYWNVVRNRGWGIQFMLK